MELKSCPFCGGEAFIRRLYSNYIVDAKHDRNCPEEWLKEQGIFSARGLWDKAFTPIPADIAVKLGIQPKEAAND